MEDKKLQDTPCHLGYVKKEDWSRDVIKLGVAIIHMGKKKEVNRGKLYGSYL